MLLCWGTRNVSGQNKYSVWVVLHISRCRSIKQEGADPEHKGLTLSVEILCFVIRKVTYVRNSYRWVDISFALLPHSLQFTYCPLCCSVCKTLHCSSCVSKVLLSTEADGSSVIYSSCTIYFYYFSGSKLIDVKLWLPISCFSCLLTFLFIFKEEKIEIMSGFCWCFFLSF